MSVYSLKDCESLIDRYVNTYGGIYTEVNKGVLGLGTVLLHSASGKKTIVIKEIFVNAWVSYHTVRKYNRVPNKYKRYIQ